MNTSFHAIARRNRIIALDTLRRKKQLMTEKADVLCLQSMRQQRKMSPVFTSTRAHQFEERLAA